MIFFRDPRRNFAESAKISPRNSNCYEAPLHIWGYWGHNLALKKGGESCHNLLWSLFLSNLSGFQIILSSERHCESIISVSKNYILCCLHQILKQELCLPQKEITNGHSAATITGIRLAQRGILYYIYCLPTVAKWWPLFPLISFPQVNEVTIENIRPRPQGSSPVYEYSIEEEYFNKKARHR